MSGHHRFNADQALQFLLEGNLRFRSGKPLHPRQSRRRRSEALEGQNPVAAVLSCADSRVPPEILFDQGIGDLFVLRNAGNVVDESVLGSLEFAVAALGIPLILVMGHSQCGALTAAVEGRNAPGYLGKLLASLQPAVRASRESGGDPVLDATRAHVLGAMEKIRACEPVLAQALRNDQIKVVGGMYHLATGQVEII